MKKTMKRTFRRPRPGGSQGYRARNSLRDRKKKITQCGEGIPAGMMFVVKQPMATAQRSQRCTLKPLNALNPLAQRVIPVWSPTIVHTNLAISCLTRAERRVSTSLSMTVAGHVRRCVLPYVRSFMGELFTLKL
jgi:hypothetical protein